MESNSTAPKQDLKPKNPFFKNADVEAKYIAPFGADPEIHIPGKYSGKLSGISLEVAEKLVAMKDNQVQLKK